MSLDSKQLVSFFFSEVNELRTTPHHYIVILRDRIPRYSQDNIYARKDIHNLMHQTQQGPKAVEECIEWLEKYREKVAKLQLSLVLCQIAFMLADKLPRRGQLSEQDLQKYEGMLYRELEKYCKAQSQLTLIIQYGFRKDKELLQSILIDDGNQSRFRRQILLDKDHQNVGIGVSEHQQFDYMVIFIFSGELDYGEEKKQKKEPKCQCSIY